MQRFRTAIDNRPVEQRNYTDLVTNALIDAATNPASGGYISALEIASGMLARAFASAEVTGSSREFTAGRLSAIARDLIERGEAIYARFGANLLEGVSYQLLPTGDYEITLAGQLQRIVNRPADRAFNPQWNRDARTGMGIGPLGTAQTLKQLMSRLEGALATEGNAAIGYLLPVPSDGQAGNIDQLKKDLANLQGRIAVIETTRAGWGEGGGSAPRRDFELARMGPAYPDGNVELFQRARDTVLAACGVPIALMIAVDGTGQREAWRRYLHGTVAPLGRIVEDAARAVGIDISFNWDALFASDIQGRARAFQSLVGGGMDIERAAAASGLLMEDES